MRIVVGLTLVLAVGGAAAQTPPPPATTPADKAKQLREVAGLLELAAKAKEKGNRVDAEFMFSKAELILGPAALADLAPFFREGAPPRVTTPTVKVDPNAPKQPLVVGASDEEEPPKKAEKGSLAGVVALEGAKGFSIVTLEPAAKGWKKRAPKQRVVEQRDREFVPRVLAVPLGSTVSFPNFDAVYHNVFSTSQAQRFDLGIYPKGEAREIVMDKEGVVRLGCNLHANMSSIIVVVAAPHYAVTDEAGKFRFASLKPGKYTLRVYSERAKAPHEQPVTIAAGPNQVTVGIKADLADTQQPDKFGTPRGKK
jgi:plastocyanin